VPLLLPAVKCSSFHGLRAGGRGKSKEAVRELVRRQLAHQHRAGSGELFGAGRVRLGDVVLQQFRLTGRRDALGVDNILEADRDAVQWVAWPVSHDRRLGSAGVGESTFLSEVDKGMQLVVERMYPFETGLGQFDRRQLFGRNLPSRVCNRQDCLHHFRSSSVKP
jgi:hypothetical protein